MSAVGSMASPIAIGCLDLHYLFVRFSSCCNALIGLTIVWFLFAVSSWLFYCGLHLKQNFEGGWLVCPLWGFEIQFGVFVLNSVIDLCILVLPVRSVSMLQMKTQKKIHLLVVFLLGGL
ncbi:hypothetical protein M7I_6715 [Glarea lozoyensis 74030]|uniref:Integral membrane protein n=1 Tax=Glarea lozoyensis (strain ATCC 74030 / MF5533) TaxID=1104152 RepID=H0EVB9_GLAL7|nr:hypothetical protein M7I_6715 [Glarea lozoyensis 74030]